MASQASATAPSRRRRLLLSARLGFSSPAVGAVAQKGLIHPEQQAHESQAQVGAFVHPHEPEVRLDLHQLQRVRPRRVVGSSGGQDPEGVDEGLVAGLELGLREQGAELAPQLLGALQERLKMLTMLQVPQQVGAQSFPCSSWSATR